MSLHPTGLLGLVLLLGQTICAQEGESSPDPPPTHTTPSQIQMGPALTIVCRGPAGVETFCLENEEDTNDFKDTRASSPLGPHQTEARFLIPAVSEGTATHYRCRYIKEHVWSEPSESLELVVTAVAQGTLDVEKEETFQGKAPPVKASPPPPHSLWLPDRRWSVARIMLKNLCGTPGHQPLICGPGCPAEVGLSQDSPFQEGPWYYHPSAQTPDSTRDQAPTPGYTVETVIHEGSEVKHFTSVVCYCVLWWRDLHSLDTCVWYLAGQVLLQTSGGLVSILPWVTECRAGVVVRKLMKYAQNKMEIKEASLSPSNLEILSALETWCVWERTDQLMIKQHFDGKLNPLLS
ncbi:Leukocyte-associated immunoglobulin-like receptor 1 [Camelus dromedarius]|uniref:Leukocyte-associated immunoglobulin-like receptor 1 n=1 Tax=Camelus dromedarius TaxID=9838 RepID=A0A5N4DRQ4_CAMDR|nr:Leukocyte-associated immunoglobulin-like receptor 1 [Camelus dromedarius]